MNDNQFKNRGIAVSGEDFAAAELEMGVTLPTDLKKFIGSVSNGGVPQRAYWPLNNGEFLWVNCFLPLKNSFGRGRTIEETYQFCRKMNFLPEGCIPFAIDYGGNYFCADQRGTVFFFATDELHLDRSIEQNMESAQQCLDNGIIEFWNGLKEEGY